MTLKADLTNLDACALSRAIHSRALSCVEVMQTYLDRIARVNPGVNAIVSLLPREQLMATAHDYDLMLERGQSMGWMHGMPQAIKDLSHARGLPTSMGSPLMHHQMPEVDGLMVRRMKAAGCIVIGKTNTPEFGLGSHTFNPVFGATGNAWNPALSAGGSSGGAAVALAQRLLPVADGSDFMGSLRNPAGWNHVFGLRPSQGRVPMAPANDVWIAQLGTEGPMARTVNDLSMLLSTQAGFDTLAPLSIREDPACFAAPVRAAAPGQRIGWLGDLKGYLPMEEGVLDCCESALSTFGRAGCHISPADLGTAPERVWEAWLVWRQMLVASRIAPLLLKASSRAHMKPEALWEHDQAQSLSGARFMGASVQRTAFLHALLQQFEHHDFLALPCAQVWPFDGTQRWPQAVAGRAMDTYHRWMEVVIYATFAGLPCISIPAGFGPQGLPMGLQIMGRPGGELALLQLARAYELEAAELLARRPPEHPAQKPPSPPQP